MRKPRGKGWKKVSEEYGTALFEHTSGAWATSSYEDTVFYVSTHAKHEEFVRRAFGMIRAEKTLHGESNVLLSLGNILRERA